MKHWATRTAFVFLISTNAAMAASNDPGRPGMEIATGICSRLITGADDYTSKCDGQMASITQGDGGVLFLFSVQGVKIGFHGDGHKVAPGLNGIPTLPIDAVYPGDPEKGMQADGSCLFTDPHEGAAIVWCVAQTKGGPFVAMFRTDGKAPVEQK